MAAFIAKQMVGNQLSAVKGKWIYLSFWFIRLLNLLDKDYLLIILKYFIKMIHKNYQFIIRLLYINYNLLNHY